MKYAVKILLFIFIIVVALSINNKIYENFNLNNDNAVVYIK